jgi:hypothetical protein
MAPSIPTRAGALFALDVALVHALESMDPGGAQDPVWTLLQNKLRSAWLDNRVSRKLAASDETLAYYLRLVADRLVHKFGLLEVAGKRPFPWADFLEARSRGDFSGMASLLRREFGMPDRVQTYLEWSTELRKPGP